MLLPSAGFTICVGSWWSLGALFDFHFSADLYELELLVLVRIALKRIVENLQVVVPVSGHIHHIL